MGDHVHLLKNKRLVLAVAATAVLVTAVLLLGPFDLRFGVAALAVLGAAVAAYLVRGVRRIGRRTATSVRNLRNLQNSLTTVQQLVRDHETHLEGTVASLTALASQDRFELIGVLEAQTKAVEAVSTQLSDLERHVAKVEREVGTTATANDLKRLAKSAARGEERHARLLTQADRANFAQVEALLELRDLLPRRAPMPPTRGFPAAPTTLLHLVQTVLERRPGLVVECGSGVSSVWVGYALERLGAGRCIALEHDPEFAQQTRDAVARHGLSGIVEVRDAPLRPIDVAGETFQWYDREALHDIRDADVVFVDGPPGFTGPLARFPAVPVLKPLLNPAGAVVVLDDAGRPEEQAIQQRWCEEFGATVLHESTVESGMTALSVPA